MSSWCRSTDHLIWSSHLDLKTLNSRIKLRKGNSAWDMKMDARKIHYLEGHLKANKVILGHLNLEGLCESHFLVKHWSIFFTLTPLCWDLPRGCHNLKWRTCDIVVSLFSGLILSRPPKRRRSIFDQSRFLFLLRAKSLNLTFMCTVAALCPWSTKILES